MSKRITKESLLSTFPYALARDSTKVPLAVSCSGELQQLNDDNNKLIIYANIRELPESLLDILAEDFKIDWYLYDGTLETKRAQLQSCFYVHRHLGTKGALVFALSDICPGTDVEEWNEYGGNPYHFRIILDVTEQRLPISQDIVDKIVDVVKPARAVLEKNSIIYRSRNTFLIGVKSGYALFTARLCGRYPKEATQGDIGDNGINLGMESDATAFSARMCGMPIGTLI